MGLLRNRRCRPLYRLVLASDWRHVRRRARDFLSGTVSPMTSRTYRKAAPTALTTALNCPPPPAPPPSPPPFGPWGRVARTTNRRVRHESTSWDALISDKRHARPTANGLLCKLHLYTIHSGRDSTTKRLRQSGCTAMLVADHVIKNVTRCPTWIGGHPVVSRIHSNPITANLSGAL